MKCPTPLTVAAVILAMVGGSPPVAGQAPAIEAPGDAVEAQVLMTLRERMVRSVLPTREEDVREVHHIAAPHAASMDPHGRWADFHYDASGPWSGAAHLQRVLLMARSARLHRESGNPDDALTTQVVAGLRAWTAVDLQNPSWWFNYIGVPQLVGEIACLLGDDLPPDQLDAAIRILRRADMEGMTGANLTWCAMNQVVLGCLKNSEATVRQAYDRMYEEVRIVGIDEEGIQADFSFHQHGKQFYSGGYGLFFANDVGRFIAIAHGTPFEIPADRRAVFDAYMLDGMRWMTWRDVLDYSTIGRIIVRAGAVAVPTDWSLGPISPAGPPYSLGNVVRLLSELPGPRQAEYADFARDLASRDSAAPFVGHKHFWRSDYTAHRRPGYLASIKMYSERIVNGEIVNREGLKSHHLSDGLTFLYRTGSEYKDIFPVWDWQKLPGTTAEQVGDGSAEEMHTIEPHAVGRRSDAAFVGGVSDGRYGLSAMHLRRGALSARKAWVFFDDGFLCLGSDISIANDHPVVTAVNQVHLVGDVRADGADDPLPAGQSHDLTGTRWVHHDGVGYIFPVEQPVRLTTLGQTGWWADLGGPSAAPVTLPVFNLWIDHGGGPRDAGYAYFVLPGANAEQTAERARAPQYEVIANTPGLQAVSHERLQLAALAFWAAGGIDTEFGRATVDQPCLLLLRRGGEGLHVTAADPTGRLQQLVLDVAGRRVELPLPTGPDAGRSVELLLQ